MRGQVAAVTGCAFLFIGAEARADGMRLEYQRSPDVIRACPDEETFRQMATVWARGEDPFRAGAVDAVRVVLDRSGPNYRATIALVGPDGEQRGNAEVHTLSSCIEVAREAASSVYLAVAPVTGPAAPAPRPPPAASPVPPPAAPVHGPAPAPPPAPARRVLVQVGAGAAAVLGFSPNPSAGFGGFVGVRFQGMPAWSLSAEARADIDTAGAVVPLSGGGSAQPRAGFAGGTLAPCVHASWFLGCGLVTLGQVRTAAGDEPEPRGGDALYFGVGARAGVEIPIIALPARPAIAVQVTADGLVSVVRPGVRVNGEALWQAPLAAGLFGARLVTIF